MEKNKNVNKSMIDVFAGLKFVDNLLEEAAASNVNPAMKETFEAKLKAKLLGENIDENRYTRQNNEYPNYEYESINEAPEEMSGEEMPNEEMPSEEMPSASGTEALPTEPVDDDSMPGEDNVEDAEDIENLVDELLDSDITETEMSSLGGDNDENHDDNKDEGDSDLQTIEEVIDEMTSDSIEEDVNGVKDGVKLGDKEPKDNIQTNFKPDQTKRQGDIKLADNYSKLGDKDLTDKVTDKNEPRTTSAEPSKVANKADIDQSKARKDVSKATADYSSVKTATYSQLKKESLTKAKALYLLAEKYIALEDQNKELKLENHKAVKATGILSLAPESIQESTRIALVKKFDECKTRKEVDALYAKAVKLIKESKSATQFVARDKTIKVLKEDNNQRKQQVSEFEKRQAFLSGAKGYEDQYGNC